MERTVEPLDLQDPDHCEFMYDLAMACKADFLDDFQNDIILIMRHYAQQIADGDTKAYLCKEGDDNAGIIWVDIDAKRIGYLHAGLLPAFRKGFTAIHFLRLFTQHCFGDLGIRKLEAYIPTHNKAAEKILKRIGFRKFGLRYEATLINGEPETHVLLGLSPGGEAARAPRSPRRA